MGCHRASSWLVVSLALLMALSVCLPAAAASGGSPLAQRVHPRLFIIADGSGTVGVPLATFRLRLKTTHASAFQTYINAIDAQAAVAPAAKQQGARIADGIGYAMLAMVDAPSLGFRTARTAAEYAVLARAHAIALLPSIADGTGDTDDLEQFTNAKGPASMGVALIYDWTVNRGIWSVADKQALANAFIAGHDLRVRTALWRTVYPMSEGNPSRTHRGQYGALAMWGDDIPGIAATGQPFDAEMQRLLDHLIADWEGYLLPALDFLLQGRSGWGEGVVYNQEGYNTSAMILGGMSTALGRNYFAESGFLHYWTLWMLGMQRPTPLPSGAYAMTQIDTSGMRGPSTYTDYGRTLYSAAAMLDGVDDTMSTVARWMIERYDFTPRTSDQYVRCYWWLWRFIWSYEHLPAPRDPVTAGVPLSLKQGQMYTFRSGYGSESDSLVVFLANPNPSNTGGHAAIDNASIIIEKYGMLVPQGGNRKNGAETPHVSSQLDFGLMGVYKPGETTVESESPGNFMGMKYQSSIKSMHAICSVENCGAGTILAEVLNRGDFDFVSFDYSRSWNAAKVTRAQRDFYYLRPKTDGEGEYILVVDRVSTADPSYQKRWHIKVPFDAEAAWGGTWALATAGTPSARAGAVPGGVWEAPGQTVLKMVNRYGPAHGVLYMQSLAPSATLLRKIGGDGWEFRDAELKNYNLDVPDYLTDSAADVMGRYRLEVVATNPRKDDLFETVIQIGDADTLSAMTPMQAITAGAMQGVAILDPVRTRVVLFSSAIDAATVTGDVSYAFPSASASVSHLLTNLRPSTTYYLVQGMSGGLSQMTLSLTSKPGASTLTTDSSGVLNFVSSAGAILSPPRPPDNVTIVR